VSWPDTEFDRSMLLKEAEWTWSETEDFVRLIQRYRSLYVTALFLAIGWSLGQALGVDRSGQQALGVSSTGQTPEIALLSLRHRPDIAAILCIVPMLNAVFFLLMIEASRHLQSLARYRFLLGWSLGRGQPVWRWELWRTTDEGTVRPWTNSSNIFLGLLAIVLTIASFVFPIPAIRVSSFLSALWLVSLVFVASVISAITIAGWRRRRDNQVADSPIIDYDSLWPAPRRRP
jgi:hypothetical protein